MVKEQLTAGHLQPSTSPWNTPIFVIKKKSEKWRLLHDLRAINSQMHPMGPIQCGLPLVSVLPRNWPTIIVDLKDCFFSIPLHKDDCWRFAFTLPAINHSQPDQRYEWTVLPQGMTNSPTLCQIYVDKALCSTRETFTGLIIYHYMDDILLCHQDTIILQNALCHMTKELRAWGLAIAPEKIQTGELQNYLGTKLSATTVRPLKLTIRVDQLTTLNDFQKLLGDINWIRPYLRLSTGELKPLFNILKGDPDLNSKRSLTPEARQTIDLIQTRLESCQVVRCDPSQPLLLIVLPEPHSPSGVIWQDGPLQSIHLASSPARMLQPYPLAVSQLLFKGIEACMSAFGRQPATIITPYTADQIKWLTNNSSDWAILYCTTIANFDNHYPKHPWIQFCKNTPIIFPKITRHTPIHNCPTVFTDGSKNGVGSVYIDGHTHTTIIQSSSAQVSELAAVILAFKLLDKTPFNLLTDSNYVVNSLAVLETVPYISPQSVIAPYFSTLQTLILSRSQPFFVGHIRAHTNLPGPLTKGNSIADMATKSTFIFSIQDQAKLFHERFHVNSTTLTRKFQIPKIIARQIVKDCQHCAPLIPVQSFGVNPRGLLPNHIWQMDVTHIPEFGNLKYVHVSVDTSSGVIIATPLAGEKVSNVIQHCLHAFACWGFPKTIKTDNGPAYTSKAFKNFADIFGIQLITGIPYNPQGQGIIERTHLTLKNCLIKQKGGIGASFRSPKDKLNLILFILNFLTLDNDGRSAADRHYSPNQTPQQWARWKDILTGEWKGPDPVLRWARGSVCVFPQDRQTPIWVPERLTRVAKDADPAPSDKPPDADECSPGNE